MDASTAALSVQLSTGLTAAVIACNNFVVGFSVVVVDVEVVVVVVGFNVVAENVAKVWLTYII